METTNDIRTQLIQVVETLSPVQQAEVLDFASFLRERQLAWKWDAIPDEHAAALKAEFADEDAAFSESALVDYSRLLQREDEK
jgi:hypothetical protein